jgi:hypothetical protein
MTTQGTLFLVDNINAERPVAQLLIHPTIMSLSSFVKGVDSGALDLNKFWAMVEAQSWGGYYFIDHDRQKGALLMTDAGQMEVALQIIRDCPEWCVFIKASVLRDQIAEIAHLLAVVSEHNAGHRLVVKFGPLLNALQML